MCSYLSSAYWCLWGHRECGIVGKKSNLQWDNEICFGRICIPASANCTVLQWIHRHLNAMVLRITIEKFVIQRFCLFSGFLSGVVSWPTAMIKAGATKVGLPKPGLQERAKQAPLAPSSSTTTSTAMKTSRSSNMLASDQRLSRVSQAHNNLPQTYMVIHLHDVMKLTKSLRNIIIPTVCCWY